MSGITLDHTQALNRLKDIADEVERLKQKKDRAPEDIQKVAALREEFHKVNEHRHDLEHDATLTEIRSALANSENGTKTTVTTEAGSARPETDGDRFRGVQVGSMSKFKNPWDLSEVRTFGRSQETVDTELRGRAYDAIERMPHATDAVREATTKIVETGGTRLAKMNLATTSPEYMRGFVKLLKNEGQMAILDGPEKEALTRAMSLTDSAGGYLIPMQLDPTVMITANGSANDVRRIARVVQATGDVWTGISSAGVTGSWDAEAAEVSDDSPTFASPTIPNYKGAVFVAISYEAQADEANVAGEIARLIAFEKDRMESVAFVTGSGSGEPTGIITALTGTASVVNSATTDTFAQADVYGLDSALPARYAANASWLAHRATYNLTRRFDANGGSALWATLGEGLPQQLLGRPAYTAEAMDGVINALAANPMLVFGDFSNFVITDRVGTTVSYIPWLMGANRRPTGQAGWYAYFRTGSDSINDAGFRLLDVT